MRASQQFRIAAICAAIICVAYMLWPGDAPFAFDEAVLIGKALRANESHTLAASGLHGTKGITYSPLPVWIYQVALLITHDLRVIVAIRAILCAGIVGASLLWLARNLDLPPLFAPVVMLSPSLWFFCRQLWDNTLCIPLSALALASFVAFQKSRSNRALILCIACLLAAPLIHVMSVSLVAPIALHLLITARRELLRSWRAITMELIAAGAIAIPWMRTMLQGAGADVGAGPDGWWFPLLGARTISGAHLSYIFGSGWDDAGEIVGQVVRGGVYVSLLAYPLMWLGLGAAVYGAIESPGRKRPVELRDHLCLILLGSIFLQTLMDGLGSVWGLPHYYNGNWIVFPMLAWLGIDLLKHVRLASALIVAQGAALLVLMGFLAIRIHRGHGCVHPFYGPSISLRTNVIAALNSRGWHGPFAFVRPGSDRYVVDPLNADVPLTPIQTDVSGFLAYPQSMNVLQELLAPASASFPQGRTIAVRLSEPRSWRCELSIVDH